MGHKMPKDKKTSYDENITETMAQDKKGSGLYQDRDEKGKLPKDRVALHYDRMDQMREAKMAQETEAKQIPKFDISDSGYVGRSILGGDGGMNSIINAANEGMKNLANNPIPKVDISGMGKIGRDVFGGDGGVNSVVNAANKGLKYLFGK